MAKILFHCDNQAVAIVSIWKAGSKETIALVCLLYYSAAKYNINVCIAHIAGAKNNITVLFRTGPIQEASTTGKSYTGQHPCLANAVLHRYLMQCRHIGVAPSTHWTY